MPAKRRIAVTAPYDRWVLLGKLLERRRGALGYTYRAPQFEREREVNRRLAADFESAAPKRINHFSERSFGLIAQGYQVTYQSMLAVLRGDADELDPAGPPPGAPAREDAVRPYFDAINERRVALAARGITSPTGAQMFPDAPEDAKAWDGIGARLPLGGRVWFIAELRANADRRDPGPGAGTGTASA